MVFGFASLGGEYNITVSVANNITFAKQKYHADEVSISLKVFQAYNFYDITFLSIRLLASYIASQLYSASPSGICFASLARITI